MNYWRVILATMVIFGTGVVTGSLLVRHTESTQHVVQEHVAATIPVKSNTNIPPQGIPAVMRVEFLRRAGRELNLTQEQHEKVDRLIKESQERTRHIMEPVTPDLRAEMQHTRDDFRALLQPEQQTKFDLLIRQTLHPADKRRSNSNQLPERPTFALPERETNRP